MKSTDFIVARDDLRQCKFIETQLPDAAALPDEALLIKVDRFAFTTLDGRVPPEQGHILSLAE